MKFFIPKPKLCMLRAGLCFDRDLVTTISHLLSGLGSNCLDGGLALTRGE